MWRSVLALAGLAVIAGPAGAAAQVRPGPPDGALTATTVVQSLDFGVLMPGVPTRIAPDDGARRAEVRFDASTNRGVEIQLRLPTALVGQDGAAPRIPLIFGAGDGKLVSGPPQGQGRTVHFDPGTPVALQLNKNHAATLYLGGMAIPATNQPAGTYTAEIAVMIINTGT